MGRVGVRGVVLVGSGEGVERAVRVGRTQVGVGRSVCWVGGERGRGEWLRRRNGLLGDVGRNGGARVMVCEGGVCREGEEFV